MEKQGGDCLLEIRGSPLQGSSQDGTSGSSDGLFMGILDVDKCKDWRKENNIGGKIIQGLEKPSAINVYSTVTEIVFEISPISVKCDEETTK